MSKIYHETGTQQPLSDDHTAIAARLALQGSAVSYEDAQQPGVPGSSRGIARRTRNAMVESADFVTQPVVSPAINEGEE